MLKKIAAGYAKLFASIGKILLILAVCVGLGFAIVWPLWKWATLNPETYTLFILSILAFFFLLFIIKKVQKSTFRSVVITLLRIMVIATGILFFIIFVLKNRRILAFFSLLIMIFLYGLFSFGLRKREK